MVLVWVFPSLFVTAVGLCELLCEVQILGFCQRLCSFQTCVFSLGTASQCSPVAPWFHWLGIINPIPRLVESSRSGKTSKVMDSSPAACGTDGPRDVLSPFIITFYPLCMLRVWFFPQGFIRVKLSSLELLSAPGTEGILWLGRCGEISFIPGPYVGWKGCSAFRLVLE